jgi:hypothetical protein
MFTVDLASYKINKGGHGKNVFSTAIELAGLVTMSQLSHLGESVGVVINKSASKLMGAEKIFEALSNKSTTDKPATKKSNHNGDYKITVLVDKNPKRTGSVSAKRFDLYKTGMTVSEFISAGGKSADISWDVAHNYIKVNV